MKLQLSIYKIDRDNEIFEWLEFSDIAEKIRFRVDDWMIDSQHKMKIRDILPNIKIPTNIINNYFSYRIISLNNNKWLWYLEWIYWKIDGFKPYNVFDFLILVESDRKNIYRVFWGNAVKKLSNFTDDYFWLDILSRLIEPNDERLISIFEKKITWPIFAQSRSYRNSTSYEAEDFDFWKIFKEITANIDKKEIAEKFWVDTWMIIRSNISFLWKSSLKLWSSILNNELMLYLWKIDELLDDKKHPPRFYINEMDSLNKKKNKDIIWNLNLKLYEKLFENFKIIELWWNFDKLKKLFPNRDDFNLYDYEISHSDIQDFLLAESFKLSYLDKEIYIDNFILNDINELFKYIIENWQININSPLEMEQLIEDSTLYSLWWDDSVLTYQKFKKHITWELFYRNKNYFIIEWEYFILRDTYIKKLTNRFTNILNSNLFDDKIVLIPNEKSSKKEGEYNLSFCWKKNFLVFDTFTPDWIELADFIYFENNNIYIFHVKKWFWWSLRDLANQIELSAKRLNSSIKTQINKRDWEKDYLTRLYNNAIKSTKKDIKNQFKNISLINFLEKFNNNPKIHYVMTIISDSDNVDDLINSDSNIWKFSVINAYQSVILNWFNFHIKLIKKDS